jgi:hypothetical protein
MVLPNHSLTHEQRTGAGHSILTKLYESLHALIGERVPLHIWGPCGVGKSPIVGQVAADLNYNFLDVRVYGWPTGTLRSGHSYAGGLTVRRADLQGR